MPRIALALLRLLLLLAAFATSLAVAEHPRADSDIELQELAEGVWLHTSHYTYPSGTRYPSNGLIVEEDGELTLIDTAWGELATLRLLEAVAARLRLPIRRAIVTHAHSDRAGGVDVLESRGIEVYAHPMTQRFTIEYGLPVPNRTLDGLTEPGDSKTIGQLEVLYPGPAHALDNLVVWLPAERILFGGCAVRAMASQTAGNTSQGDVESWLRVLKLLEERYGSAGVVVPGHGQPGGPELLAHTFRLVGEASRRARDISEAQ